MNFKDKRMLIIGSGAFLLVLTFMLFFTLQSKDNMMSNTGRYSGDITLGDTIDHCAEYNWVLNNDNSGIKASCTAVPKNNSNDMYRTCMPAQDYECESAGINTGVCYIVAEFNKSGCKTCEAGTYLSKGVCVNCSPGFYCEENSQFYCPAGSYNPDSNGTSIDSCLPCSGENDFSAQGAVSCSSCGAGNPANPNHTGCTNPTSTGCNPGYWKTVNGCEKCPTGSYCPDGQSKFQCDGNLISTEQGNVACNSRCSVGTQPNSEHTACEACKTNEVSPDGSACVVCPAGQEPNSNQTECICSDNTQIKVLNHIINTFGKPAERGTYYAKPVTIWAKSPINDKQIHHYTVAVRINGDIYLYDMPQSEFISQIDNNKGEVVKFYQPRLIKYNEENLKKFYGTNEEFLHINDESILDDDIIELPVDSRSTSPSLNQFVESLPLEERVNFDKLLLDGTVSMKCS